MSSRQHPRVLPLPSTGPRLGFRSTRTRQRQRQRDIVPRSSYFVFIRFHALVTLNSAVLNHFPSPFVVFSCPFPFLDMDIYPSAGISQHEPNLTHQSSQFVFFHKLTRDSDEGDLCMSPPISMLLAIRRRRRALKTWDGSQKKAHKCRHPLFDGMELTGSKVEETVMST